MADGASLTLAQVGPAIGLLAIMASDADPKKPDPAPVPLMLEATRRDLASTASERQILAIGPARW
jgi:phosphoglycolate phosphatase-like HAD superfamily hydrolase